LNYTRNIEYANIIFGIYWNPLAEVNQGGKIPVHSLAGVEYQPTWYRCHNFMVIERDWKEIKTNKPATIRLGLTGLIMVCRLSLD
jgi:hypothetical protein